MKHMLLWDPSAWDDYVYWQKEDKRIVKKINALIEDILRHPFTGIGKPESLQFHLKHSWSRRITKEHRLVYEVKDNLVIIQQCRYHY